MVVVPARMGRINKRSLLPCLQRLGLASRAELAQLAETICHDREMALIMGEIHDIIGEYGPGKYYFDTSVFSAPGRWATASPRCSPRPASR